MTMRSVVIVEAEDGVRSVYGPWRDREKALRLADKLRRRSSAYTGDSELPMFRVAVEWLDPWPGLKVAAGE